MSIHLSAPFQVRDRFHAEIGPFAIIGDHVKVGPG